MQAKEDVAVCLGHIFLEEFVDIRRKVKSFTVEKEGCCSSSCVSAGASNMHSSKGRPESLSGGTPDGSDVGFYSSSCTVVRVDSGHCLIQLFRMGGESLTSDPLCFLPCLLVWCCFVLGFRCCCFCLFLCFYQKMKTRPGTCNDQRT